MTALREGSPIPLVSVLLPCWNAESTIARALSSVLDERSVPLECIVVDDGSTDRTADIVAGIAAGDERVTLVQLPANAGVSNARNVGLELVRSTWLTLLDADDRFLPAGLGTLIRAATATNARAVIGQQVWWNGRRSWITSGYDIPDIRAPGRKSLAANPGLVDYASPHAKLFHRSCFEGLRFSGRVLGDQPWIIRALIRAGEDIEVVGETVYEWYRPRRDGGPASITSITRASARRSVESAEVAVGAFAAVAEEAARHLDEQGRDAILARYAERLLRSDLGLNLSRAMARGDPDTAALFDAVRAFVVSVPSRYLAASQALARDLLEPPLRFWRRLDDPARAAYGLLVKAALAADPACIERRPLAARIALAAGLRRRDRFGHAVAASLLTLEWLAEGAMRRVRRIMPR